MKEKLNKFFQNTAYKFRRFMTGRYGIDRLWTVLIISYLIIIILANIFYRFSKIFYYAVSVLAAALIIFAIFRVFSKNIEARKKENEAWLRFASKIKQKHILNKNKWQNRKTHKFVKCPRCRRNLRLPKHKGKINVTCPHCNNKFIINTGKKK